MDILNLENVAIDWNEIIAERIEGETGFVISKTKEIGNIRLRHQTFSENFKADHWCEKGHILLVLNGVLIIEFKDGTSVDVTKGNSYVLSDNVQAHKAISLGETEVFIVD